MNSWLRRALNTGGGSVVYWISPTAPARPWLVFLHGLGSDHRLFDSQYPHFAKRYNLLTWDAPAHGDSRPYADDPGYDQMAVLLGQIIDAEQITRPVMVGQSMGAFVMQCYLCHRPQGMAGFVAIDSMPLIAHYYRPTHLRAYRKGGRYLARLPECMLRKMMVAGLAATARGRRQACETLDSYSHAELCRLIDQGFKAVAEVVELGPEFRITCPALLICGEQDHAGFTRDFNARWHQLGGLPMVWVPSAGHNSNVDNAQVVNAAIDAFLAERETSTRVV